MKITSKMMKQMVLATYISGQIKECTETVFKHWKTRGMRTFIQGRNLCVCAPSK